MNIKIQIIDETLYKFPPSVQTEGSAGIDLRACIKEEMPIEKENLITIGAGFKIAIPGGHVGLLCSRSGATKKRGIIIANSPGIIDSDYRGEIKMLVFNRDLKGTFYTDIIRPYDRLAQLLIVPVIKPKFEIVDKLPKTDRGAGGLGHTGVL